MNIYAFGNGEYSGFGKIPSNATCIRRNPEIMTAGTVVEKPVETVNNCLHTVSCESMTTGMFYEIPNFCK